MRALIAPQLEELSEASVADLAEQITLPPGFVATFDRPGGCPKGWLDMSGELRGRMIVGAVRNSNDKFAFRSLGGAETHTLTADEMPSHQHSMGVSIRGEDGGSGYPYTRPANGQGDPTSQAGGGHPHNNTPPYMALYFCKKE